MKYPRLSLALSAACVLGAPRARAQIPVLVAAGDPSQIAEVELAQVMAANSSEWLSVNLNGRARLAVAIPSTSVETTRSSEAWLRALDFATRVRVVPPLGPLADCGEQSARFADSGLPEAPAISPSRVLELDSEIELRRNFEAAGLSVDLAKVLEFSKSAAPPFHFALYEAGPSGGSTSALGLVDRGKTGNLPQIVASGRDSVPLTLLALAPGGVAAEAGELADRSELKVTYFGATASSDYATARSTWLASAPGRWLVEARDSSALFAWSVLPGSGALEPAVGQYFAGAPGVLNAASCAARVQRAHTHASHDLADYSCDGADDLARSLSELDFSDVRLTRLFGAATPSGARFRVTDSPPEDPHLVATDVDTTGCKAMHSGTSSETTPAPGGSSTPPVAGYASGDSTAVGSQESVPAGDSGSVDLSIPSSSANDSCSGSSSSSDSSSNDSCSGNSSSSDSNSNDSCSGNSSSSSSSSDSSGCGNGGYNGDTCSGSSAPSGAGPSDGKSTAALGTPRHPRRVRLSLFTLLAAALAFPLRRRSHWRGVALNQ